MVEPVKPFACTIPECGMTFTNEDHLHVHTKKHDMVLQLGLEQKTAFVADQTPTPTRFIRNCEEVGLFQDLQNVNPFDEGFKRAMETKHGILCLENAIAASSSSDELHTPQMVFPLIDGDSALYSTTNNQRNITISRSSSDESGAIKEFERTTISKLTNEVTTISRIVGKTDDKQEDKKNDSVRKDSVSYTNNVIKIHSSNLVRKDSIDKNPVQTLIYEDTVIKDSNVLSKDALSDKVNEIPAMMSQKSLDLIVDSLNDYSSEENLNKNTKRLKKDDDDYEVIIKLPNGKQVRMRAVEETTDKVNAKELLKKTLTEKIQSKNNQKHSLPAMPLVPIATGTLIPVTIVNSTNNLINMDPTNNLINVNPNNNLINVNPNNNLIKVPITPFKIGKMYDKKPVKRKAFIKKSESKSDNQCASECDKVGVKKKFKNSNDLESKSAASRRYRARLKETWSQRDQENKQLRQINERLIAEQTLLKMKIMEHLRRCPHGEDLKNLIEK